MVWRSLHMCISKLHDLWDLLYEVLGHPDIMQPIALSFPTSWKVLICFWFQALFCFWGREEESISLWWKEEEETVPTWVFTCDFVWLLWGFQMDGENELGLQMVHSVVNWLAETPFLNKPSNMEQLHTEHVFKYRETILQQRKALQLLRCLVRNRVVVVLWETWAMVVGGVRVGGVCRLLDKPWRLKSCFKELQLLEIRLVRILLALLAPSGWLLVAHSY